MKKGIFYATTSMALWGFVFVLPSFNPNFTGIEIALARFFCYGLASLLVALFTQRGVKTSIESHHFPVALLMALTGSLVYYMMAVKAIKLLGAAPGTLLFSLMPVSVSIYGNMKNKTLPFKALAIPLTLIALGMSFAHYDPQGFETDTIDWDERFFGLVIGIISVLMWAWYAVNNGHYLCKNPQICPNEWTSLVGVFCFFGSLILIAYFSFSDPDILYIYSDELTSAELNTFILTSLIGGIGSSWLTTLLWNKASTLLPMALLGQLVVFEIIFGLLYIFLYEARTPELKESIGITLVLSGILLTLYQTRRHRSLSS